MNSSSHCRVHFYLKKIGQISHLHSLRWLSLLGFLALAFTPGTAFSAGPSFTGSTTAISVNQDDNATSVRSLLTVSDTDSGKTLTWSQSAAPAHGTLAFSSATASSGSTSITPGGTITYTPTAFYNGADSFAVQVSDGNNTATRTISVTVDCIHIYTNVVGVSARPGQIGTYWVENRGSSFGWITNVLSNFGGIPMRGYFQFRVGTGAWQTLGQYGSANMAPSGATIRYVDTNPNDSTTSQSFHIGWSNGGSTTTTGMNITPGAPPTGVTADASAIWNNAANGSLAANLTPVGLNGGMYVVDSQSTPNLLAVSGTTLVLGAGTMPAAGQVATVTLRYYDPYQLDCNGNPIDNSASAGSPALQTLNFTIRDATPNPQASFVLGQPNFTNYSSGTTINTLNYPQSMAIDTNHGKVYIADTYNNRVLRYAWPVTGNQPNAEVVFGQSDFVSSAAACSQTSLTYPAGVAVDSSGNLWVVDYGNNRVLRFGAAYQISANLAAANLVLGQASFTTSGAATGSSSMSSPNSLTMDAAGNLWVADTGNNRVLRFANANSKSSGAAADGVLGQGSFTTATGAATQAGLNYPQDLTTTGTTLFVSDAGNNRLLRYDNAASKANGGNADGVLGQANFTDNTAQTTQNGLSDPYGLCLDASGGLYVADMYNFRVLVYSNAVSKANGGNADAVIGTTSFTDTNLPGPVTQSLFYYPEGLAYDPQTKSLAVVDENNSRALVFIAPVQAASTCSVAGSPNPSTYGDSVTFTATVTRSSGSATPGGTVTFSEGGTTLGSGALAGSGASATATYSTSALTTGSHTITATYSGDANFLASTGTVASAQIVNQATPVVTTWPTASTITYGQTLADSTLANGAATPSGSFSWTTSSTMPGAGTVLESVTFTPTDTVNYSTVTSTVSLIVNQATPVVTTWPTASDITYGQTLADSTLSGGAATPTGTFAWTTSSTAPGAGTASQSVTFIPSDTTDYTTVTSTVSVTVNKATPSITTWPSASTITYGQTLASSTLSGGAATPAGGFAWTTSSTTPGAGTAPESVTFTPADTANYVTVSGTVNVTVNQAAPTITTWPTASDITYGQTLANSTLTGGTATPSGTFTWTTPSTAPGAGTASQSVTFTPLDSTNYSPVTSTVSVTVNQATPAITTWPTASDITYGETLTNSTLTGGVATPSGTFAWTTPTNAPDAGTATQSVTFTPDDSTNYATVTGTVSLTVNQATPVVTTWPTASDIAYGQTLAASTLTGGVATPDGSFAWTTPGTAPGAGTASQSVTFTPTDTTNYTTLTGTVTVTVDQAASVVTTWPTASPITYGQTVTNSLLTGGVATPNGAFTWTIPTNAPGAGTATLSVTFTPDDSTNYTTITNTVSLTINQATPVVTAWPAAAAITYGQTLAASTLTGGAVTPAGNFAWTTPGIAPGTGTTPQSVTFTPLDTTNYTSVTGTVSVTVTPGTLAVVLDTNSLTQVYDGSAKSVVVLSPTNMEVDITYDGNTNAPIDAGSYTVIAVINDTNYTGSATNTLVIEPAAQTINFTNLPPFVIGDPAYSLSATASSGLPVTFSSSDNTVASVSGNTLTIVGIGSATITAAQAGDGANYLAATNVSEPVIVSPVLAGLAIATDMTNGFYTVTNVHLNPIHLNYVTNVVVVYTNVTLTITGNQGRAYELQFENDLTLSNWQTLYLTTNLPAGNYQVIDGTTNAARFYRLRRPAPTPAPLP